jgi:hypothetical protein
LGGYCGAIECPENLEKVVVDYITFEFLLSLVAGAESVCIGQVQVDFDEERDEL